MGAGTRSHFSIWPGNIGGGREGTKFISYPLSYHIPSNTPEIISPFQGSFTYVLNWFQAILSRDLGIGMVLGYFTLDGRSKEGLDKHVHID